MKKFLAILVLGLLICNVGFAAEKVYLSCESIIIKNNSLHPAFKNLPSLKEGFHNSQFFFQFKKSKSFKLKVHQQGGTSVDWKNEKPGLLYKPIKGSYENGIYDAGQHTTGDGYIFDAFGISQTDGTWSFKGVSKMSIESDKAEIIEDRNKLDIDYDHGGKCTEYDEKEFLSLLKKGIQ